MIDVLSQLPPATPDPQDADRARQRCHAALTRRRPPTRSRLDGVLFAAAAVYLVAAVIQAIAFFVPSVP